MLLVRTRDDYILSARAEALVGMDVQPLCEVLNRYGAAMNERCSCGKLLGHTDGHATGQKKDTGKPALDLIDPDFELDVARVLTFGAAKYSVENWRRGMSLGKCMAGIRRHINAIARGEFTDPETGLQHTAHAACGVMFLHYFIRNNVTNVPDDRWEK